MDSKIKSDSDRLSEIKEMFGLFSDPLDKIAQLIDIGKSSHCLTENEKTEKNLIKGCTSKAWMEVIKSPDNLYSIRTDSDSHIVSGLLYLFSLSVKNKSSSYINKINAIELLNSVGLDSHITSQRTNGFISAVETLKKRIV
tara:strand:+ start:371 stop:793 length:423 start_codon:yes stop_codon:yes gene_type:complete